MNGIARNAIVALSLAAACHAPAPVVPVPPPTLTGVVGYDDGRAAAGATIAITQLETGKLIEVLSSDSAGRYQATLPPGKYAFAVVAADGFAWIPSQEVPASAHRITLQRDCKPLRGQVDGEASQARVHAERQSLSDGDTFVTPVRGDGGFAFCLPDGQYRTFVMGGAVSTSVLTVLPTTRPVRLRGTARDAVVRPPEKRETVRSDLAGLVADIQARDPRIVGLGESMHGTAEFVPTRGELTFELIRRADVRLLLFEFDAIAGAALDDYVNGADIDVGKAVAGLGFWITDTHEFLRFLAELRAYNAQAQDKIRLWGVDVQNTTLPVELLIAHAAELSIDEADQNVLQTLSGRGKGVRDLLPALRSRVNALLARLSAPRGSQKQDVLIALAARSLAIQLDYWTGDMETWYRTRRDLGMASLIGFLLEQTAARRACLWAHDMHVMKQTGEFELGPKLAASSNHYYAIGFYLYQGETRAVDAAAKIGVIPFPIPRAPAYTIEAAVMEATGRPDVAWLPLRRLPTGLATWFDLPRYAREVGGTYRGEDEMARLRSARVAYDALVVIQNGHASSPTPTGVRTFKR
jgi:erythromycin esterase